MAQSGMRNVGRRRRSRPRKCKWRQLMLSLHCPSIFPLPPLELLLCQQARTSYDAAYLLLLFLPLVLLLLLLLLKFSMPLLSNNLLAIFCHRRVFYFPHSQSFFLVPWWLKVRDGQHEHVADKGGGAVKDFVCSLYSTACLPAVESALRVPFLLCFLLCPAAIKTDHKMASKALPAKKKNEPLPLLMQLSQRT